MPNNSNDLPYEYDSRNYTDDLIGVPPSWLLKSGITLVAVVVSLVLCLAALLKYPDKIVANGIMTSQNPPIEHLNNTPGIIEELFVRDGDIVKEDALLIYLKNNALREDVKKLDSFINEYQKITDGSTYLELQIPSGLQLGELQREYGQLQLLFSQMQQTLRQTGVFQQISTLKDEIKDTKAQREILISEKRFSKDELALKEKDYSRHVDLNKEGIVSDIDLENVESEWLRSKKAYSNLDKGIIDNKIREEQLILNTQKLIEEHNSKVQSHGYELAQTINTIQSNLKEWRRKYFVRSEIKGEVSLVPNLVEDKFVTEGTLLLSIIPTNNLNQKQIQASVSNDGIGKINVNDKVIVKVNGYPYKEFGVITSKVEAISELPKIIQNTNGQESFLYTIHIDLPDRLVTNYDEEILFRPNSSVVAEIITKDKSVLERLFETLLSLLNH